MGPVKSDRCMQRLRDTGGDFGAWQSLTPGVCITICWLRRRFTLSLVTLIYTMTLVPEAFVEMENA